MQAAWIAGLAGGLMIGSAAALLLLFNGRIMGVSGILGSLIDRRPPSDWVERALFLAGILAAPLLTIAATGPVTLTQVASPALLVAAGVVVAIGTRMGSGCTSGHGVCGIPRLSARSLVAVPVFMATGIVTVALLKLL